MKSAYLKYIYMITLNKMPLIKNSFAQAAPDRPMASAKPQLTIAERINTSVVFPDPQK